MQGTVKFFNRTKGFGFIHGDDGKDYFVHSTALPRGLFLRDNDYVSFDSVQGDRGMKAENVKLLEKGSERSGGEQQQQQPQQSEEQDTNEDDGADE
ncbi:TPA: cold-shock protein [Candidatus Woesearchaeota archaeon]|nr:cold-shock protein [Candidatus Woesearchaeota archaeon]